MIKKVVTVDNAWHLLRKYYEGCDKDTLIDIILELTTGNSNSIDNEINALTNELNDLYDDYTYVVVEDSVAADLLYTKRG